MDSKKATSGEIVFGIIREAIDKVVTMSPAGTRKAVFKEVAKILPEDARKDPEQVKWFKTLFVLAWEVHERPDSVTARAAMITFGKQDF